MVRSHVLLRLLPELVVVLALDDVATDAWDLLHALILCELDESFAKRAAATLGLNDRKEQ
jgi:hypothetical protein